MPQMLQHRRTPWNKQCDSLQTRLPRLWSIKSFETTGSSAVDPVSSLFRVTRSLNKKIATQKMETRCLQKNIIFEIDSIKRVFEYEFRFAHKKVIALTLSSLVLMVENFFSVRFVFRGRYFSDNFYNKTLDRPKLTKRWNLLIIGQRSQ